MIDSNLSDQEQASQQWHRLSPLALIYFIVKIAKFILNNALPSLAPLAVVIFSADNKSFMLAVVSLVLVILLLVGSLLQYWYFRYSLGSGKILINLGVFKKQHRVIQFDRVQNININQAFYFKPFDLVSLQIETAGSKSDEGTLAGISQSHAQFISELILSQQKNADNQTDSHLDLALTDPTGSQQPNPMNLNSQTATKMPTVIATASMGDITRYGLANNTAYLLLAVIAPFFEKIKDAIQAFIPEPMLKAYFSMFETRLVAILLMIFMVIGTTIFIMTLLSVVGAILQFYGYQLSLANNTLKRQSGLINTHQESLNLTKIQAIVRHSNLVGRWLQRENLICRQISGSGGASSGQPQKLQQFLVPARTEAQSQQLIQLFYPDHQTTIPTHPINKGYINKTLAVYFLLPSLVLSSAGYIASNFSNINLFFALLLPIAAWPLVYLRWKKYRYGMNGQYAQISSGLFGFRHVLFPLFKVQRVVISQSVLQQRRKLATLTIYLASGPLKMPYVPIEQAKHWFDAIYFHIETDDRSWF